MFPPSTTRSGGFCMCVPLFHELQMEAKRDSPVDHNVHVLFCFGNLELMTLWKGLVAV